MSQLGEAIYSFFMPRVNLMGAGSAKTVGEQAKKLGNKALIVTDAFLAKNGMADQIVAYVREAGMEAAVYPGAEPNPTDQNVHDGLKALQDHHCDVIISLGGGSSHDTAKGIGIVAGNGGNIRDYEGLDKMTQPMLPLIAVNTTAGTASEMTRFCIITNTDTHVKMAIVDWQCTPNISINDPLMMMDMPASLTAATGMDALTHAIEAYVSTQATPVTDASALMAIQLISKNLRQAVANGKNFEARDKMAYAEFLAGMAFNNASLGHVHAMAHQLGGFYNLPHGVCNAILLPHVEEFNLIACPDRFVDIAKALGENVVGMSTREAADAAIRSIRQLSKDVGIPSNLAELGVKSEDLRIMAENAMKDACSLTNPRSAKVDDIVKIFQKALVCQYGELKKYSETAKGAHSHGRHGIDAHGDKEALAQETA